MPAVVVVAHGLVRPEQGALVVAVMLVAITLLVLPEQQTQVAVEVVLVVEPHLAALAAAA